MSILQGKRRFATLFALVLAMIVGGTAYMSFAQAPSVTISGNPPVQPKACTQAPGGTAPAFVQGTQVNLSFAGYRNRETLDILFTLPDGRVLDLDEMRKLTGPSTPVPPTTPPPPTDEGGDLFLVEPTSTAWPQGCYTVTGRGLSSGQAAQGFLVIDPTPIENSVPPAGLTVVDIATNQNTALENATIKISGNGFAAGESVTIDVVQPDGTRIAFPSVPSTSANGEFTLYFRFSQARLIGAHAFIATGESSELVGTSPFTVLPDDPRATPPTDMRAIVTPDPINPALRKVTLQGEFFNPNEGVNIELRTANAAFTFGKIYFLTSLRTNAQGKFATTFTLDQRYPTGTYAIRAMGTDSGKAALVNLP